MQFAILVSVIIAILLGSFLTLTYTQQFFKVQSNLILTTIDEVNRAVDFGLQPRNSFSDSISFDRDNIKATIEKKFWGGFEQLISTASAKTKTFSKIALTGSVLSDSKIAIYMGDTKLALKLVGDTRIEGDAYVSRMGILPGIISGQPYKGKKLITGNFRRSKGVLPKLDEEWLQYVQDIANFIPSNNDVVLPQKEIVTNSFFKNSKYIYDPGVLHINEIYIGNIVIKSNSEVIVSSQAELTDVVIVAPKITIQKGFKGSANLIADAQIIIEENVHLRYPSSLVVIDQTIPNNRPTQVGEEPILISERTIVEGILVYFPKKETLQNGSNGIGSLVNIHIKPTGMIKGMVYCYGNVEVSGTVVGSIYTQRFIAREFGSIYTNYIYNGKVLGNDIHPKFCGLSFENTKKGVVKWLY